MTPESFNKKETPDHGNLIEEATSKLEKDGEYAVELSAHDFKELIEQSLPEILGTLKSMGIEVEIKKFDIAIENQQGKIELQVHGSKKILFKRVGADISADITLRNAEGEPGKLEAVSFQVAPENLYGLVNPKEKLVPYLDDKNINKTLSDALGKQLQEKGIDLQSINLEFTAQNTLSITLAGKKA